MTMIVRIGVFLMIALCSSCYKRNFKQLHPDKDPATAVQTCDTVGAISYSRQIVPLLNANCNNCHNTGGTSPDLSNYAGVLNSAQNTLYSSVVWDGNASNMPKGLPKMSDCDVTIIKKWVFAGAPNN